MKLQSLLNTIKLFFLFLSISLYNYGQHNSMERLTLQYKLMQSNVDSTKFELIPLIANCYINEGNYDDAINLIRKIDSSEKHKNIKYFLMGKAEFIKDNNKNSLNYFNKIDEYKLPINFYKEMQLFTLLNYNHLLYVDSTYLKLANLYNLAGKDTTGLYNEIKLFSPPNLYNLKKASKKSAIFPGSGLWYVHEKKHAFASSIINFAFLGYTAYSIYTKYYISSVLTGFSQFLRFYNGGKRASVKIGDKKNKQAYLN